jgi:integrase
MWQREHVRAFLNTAFSQFEWRSIGLITYMMYEWGQRPKDICELKWDSINFDKQMVVIEQSKRGATVKLPISTGLFEMLKQQHLDFPTSDYVAPLRKRWGKWMHYTAVILSRHFHAVAKLANLPDDLQLRDLRRTAITESIEGGAEMVHIMQMSGHKSIDSLNPYVVHTLRGSTRAQEMRQFPDRLLEE